MIVSRYPFLEPLERVVEGVVGFGGPEAYRIFSSDPELVEAGYRRAMLLVLGRRFETLHPTRELEAASFILSLAIASKAGPRALSRVISGEHGRVKGLLEGERQEALEALVEASGVRVEASGLRVPWSARGGRVEYRLLPWKVRVEGYLRISARASDEEPLLLLSNSFLSGGYVHLDIARLRALAYASSKTLIGERLREAGELESQAIAEKAGELGMVADGLLPYREEALPECVRSLISKALAGESLGELEAYTLLSFLSWTFGGEEVASRIAERLAGPMGAENLVKALKETAQEYPPPPCRLLEERGVCRCRGSLLGSYREALAEALEGL